jgi:ankyrin repeat protein
MLRKNVQASQTESKGHIEQRAKELVSTLENCRIDVVGRMNNNHLEVTGKLDQVLGLLADPTNRPLTPEPVPPCVAPAADPTELHIAAQNGDLPRVRQLLRLQTTDLRARNEHGATPLHLASTSEVAQRLIRDKRADPDAEDENGQTALHYAVLTSQLAVIKALLEGSFKVDTSIRDDFERTAIFYARANPAAQWLIEVGCDVEARSNDDSGDTGLLRMACLGDYDGLQFFISQNGDVNAERSNGKSATTLAAQHGNADIVQALLAHGANVQHSQPGTNRTPLSEAAAHGHTECARLLLAQGADHSWKDSRARTPVWEAARNGYVETLSLLLSHGAAPDVKGAPNCATGNTYPPLNTSLGVLTLDVSGFLRAGLGIVCSIDRSVRRCVRRSVRR